MDKDHFTSPDQDRRPGCGRVVLLLPAVLLFCLACSRSTQSGDPRKSYFTEEYQVKAYEDGKASAFGLNIAPAEEMGDWAVEWVSGVTKGEGFQYLIYADPDSWDAYLYHPEGQAVIQKLTNDDVAVEYSDGTLRVYVTSVPAGSEEDTDEEARWLLHLAAPPAGAWPSKVELYWDGREVPCDAADLKD